MKRLVYADNAATTPLDREAFEAMTPYLLDEFANASQAYARARAPKKALAEARETIAACLNARPEEIYFTSGGAESDNWAIKGVASAARESGGGRRAILASAIEHGAVLRACQAARRAGAPVAYLAPDANGVVLPAELESALSDKTALVSVMLANNELGTIQPVPALARLARRRGALFHADAVQALGHAPVDVEALGVDLLSASAHKFNGPKGVGFLYIREGTPIAPYLDGGGQERGMRAGTENVAGIVGMAVALRRNLAALATTRARLLALEARLLAGLRDAGVAFRHNAAGVERLPGVLSLSFPACDGEAILHRMDLLGVSISTGSACNSQRTEISHVLKAIRLPDALAKGPVRISLGRSNTEEDVDAIVNGLVRVVGD